MNIRTKILAGCLVLTALTGSLGLFAQHEHRNLAALALRIYDDAALGTSYLRSAQVTFTQLSNGQLPADDERWTSLQEDLAVARDRAMSPVGRAQAVELAQQIGALPAIAVLHERRAMAGRIADMFELVVETFAADGFRYRRNVGELVQRQASETTLAIVVSLILGLIVTFLLGALIAPPVRRAVLVAKAIADGRLDNVIVARGKGEPAELMRALATMQDSIAGALAHIRQLMADQSVSHAGQIAAQHTRFEAALDNMGQGLCLFDGDGRLTVANRRFIEMFGAPPAHATADQMPPGPGSATLRGVVSSGQEAVLSADLPDGRIIDLAQRPIAGGGWVTTFEDATERRATEARLAHMARHDRLTGLPNRLLFTEYMPAALARARRNEGLAILSIDLDRFKSINDSYGHAVGDALLCRMAERLKECTRESDLVIHMGGDEFVIVQESARQPTDATALARRVFESLATPFDLPGEPLSISASIGIALSDGAATVTAETLLKCADLALHRAKAEGRATFRFFEAKMDARMQTRRALEVDLRRALAERQLMVFYQPLVRASTGIISGFEALLRWQHPERGLVSPAIFIPLAEETGLIGAIGAWVLQQACQDAASWPGELKVAVNLSPAQFTSRILVDDVAEALAHSGLPAHRLELEITESVLLQDDDAALSTLHELRGLGSRIAMDDFGTGYSSLSYLRRFPFDKIKIDQSFVRGMADHGDCLAIVRAVIGLGRSLGIAVNAEGVETPEQLAALRAEGCGELQGYLFSQPKPQREVAAMLTACPL